MTRPNLQDPAVLETERRRFEISELLDRMRKRERRVEHAETRNRALTQYLRRLLGTEDPLGDEDEESEDAEEMRRRFGAIRADG